jgi:hypothetical protein
MYSPDAVHELGNEIERHVGVPNSERKATPRARLGEVIEEVDGLFQRIQAVSASIDSERAGYVEKYGQKATNALAGYVAYELRRADYCLSYLRFIHHMMD